MRIPEHVWKIAALWSALSVGAILIYVVWLFLAILYGSPFYYLVAPLFWFPLICWGVKYYCNQENIHPKWWFWVVYVIHSFCGLAGWVFLSQEPDAFHMPYFNVIFNCYWGFSAVSAYALSIKWVLKGPSCWDLLFVFAPVLGFLFYIQHRFPNVLSLLF